MVLGTPMKRMSADAWRNRSLQMGIHAVVAANIEEIADIQLLRMANSFS